MTVLRYLLSNVELCTPQPDLEPSCNVWRCETSLGTVWAQPCLHSELSQMHWTGCWWVKQLPQSSSYDYRQSLLPDTYCFNISNEDESLKQLGSIIEQGLRSLSAAMVDALTTKRALPQCVLCIIISPPCLSQILKFHSCWRFKGRRNFAPSLSSSSLLVSEDFISLFRPETLFTGVLPLMLQIQLHWAFPKQQQQIYKLAWFMHCHSHSEGWVWSYHMNFSLVQPGKVMVGSGQTELVCLQSQKDDFALHIWLENYPCSPQTYSFNVILLSDNWTKKSFPILLF